MIDFRNVLTILTWICIVSAILGCDKKDINDYIYSNFQNYDFLDKYCEGHNSSIMFDTLEAKIGIDELSISVIPNDWAVRVDSQENRRWIQMVDTTRMFDASELSFGHIQITTHSYGEQIDLRDFFTGTVKVLADSQEITNNYRIVDLGLDSSRENEKYWMGYERKDEDYGNIATLSYYWLSHLENKVFQLDLMKCRTRFSDRSHCEFQEWKKSVDLD